MYTFNYNLYFIKLNSVIQSKDYLPLYTWHASFNNILRYYIHISPLDVTCVNYTPTKNLTLVNHWVNYNSVIPNYSVKNFTNNSLNNINILFAIKSKLNARFSILRFIKLFYKLDLFDKKTLFINLYNYQFTVKDMLINLVPLIPIFGLYFNSINKYIKKYSRGKSGKFSVKLKYLPPYKRFKYFLSILTKDVMFNRKLNFNQKLNTSLNAIFYKNISSFTLKFRLILYYLIGLKGKLPIYREKRL